MLAAVPTKDDLIDEVRILEFDPVNGTKARQLNSYDDFDATLEVFGGNIGDLWWSGSIGGVPAITEETSR